MLAKEMTIGSTHIPFKSQKPYFNLSFGKDLGSTNYSCWFIPGQAQREEKQDTLPLFAKEQSRPKAEVKRSRATRQTGLGCALARGYGALLTPSQPAPF